ncbi:hypothetical protein ACROYT_G016807 [Oculina patagonica]
MTLERRYTSTGISLIVSGRRKRVEIYWEGEPLADSEDEDEDGILPSVLEQRLEGEIAVTDWCTCGNCSRTHLVGAREFRCCLEIAEARRQFTFNGLDAQ